MIALFAVTIFTGSALLFLVQPMFARMLLPLLGGSPSVWNTAMVFYQAALLAGYAYAHYSTARLGPRRQTLLQLLVLALPLVLLPIAIPEGWVPPTDRNPIPWTLGVMTVAVGLPFFAIATMSPLLQRWFTATGHARAADPYFLYSASNLGSMLALLSYPLAMEPAWSLELQTRAWMWGYIGFLVLAAVCVSRVWRAKPSTQPANEAVEPIAASSAATTPVTVGRRLRWVAWSFVPSSLMLGVTSYLTSEVAVVPLLWVVPLGLYLLTFVIAFARGDTPVVPLLGRAFPILVAAVVTAMNLQATEPLGALMLLHLAVFFVGAVLCHSRLAADRPAARNLTEFYLWLSIGGALGGIFNALIAPILFSSFAEYPTTLVLACLVALAPGRPGSSSISRWDWVAPLLLALSTGALIIALQATMHALNYGFFAVVFGVSAVVCYFLSRRPVRFALGVAGLFLASLLYHGEKGRILHTERSFFGVHRVTVDPSNTFHLLVHGKTLHGAQSIDPKRAREPLAYYHRTGPVGDVLNAFASTREKNIGVVGLGAGSLAAYALTGQSWSFFEIDPMVERLARDKRFFTFLHESRADMRVILGDARQSLSVRRAAPFDVLILDAFSSDAIPVHLMTREAIALYQQNLAPGGLLAFHISNLHLDLEPVLATLADDAGLHALIRDDTNVSAAEAALGKAPSIWLVMARGKTALGPLTHDPRWRAPEPAHARLWTDTFSSVLGAFRW